VAFTAAPIAAGSRSHRSPADPTNLKALPGFADYQGQIVHANRSRIVTTPALSRDNTSEKRSAGCVRLSNERRPLPAKSLQGVAHSQQQALRMQRFSRFQDWLPAIGTQPHPTNDLVAARMITIDHPRWSRFKPRCRQAPTCACSGILNTRRSSFTRTLLPRRTAESSSRLPCNAPHEHT